MIKTHSLDLVATTGAPGAGSFPLPFTSTPDCESCFTIGTDDGMVGGGGRPSIPKPVIGSVPGMDAPRFGKDPPDPSFLPNDEMISSQLPLPAVGRNGTPISSKNLERAPRSSSFPSVAKVPFCPALLTVPSTKVGPAAVFGSVNKGHDGAKLGSEYRVGGSCAVDEEDEDPSVNPEGGAILAGERSGSAELGETERASVDCRWGTGDVGSRQRWGISRLILQR